ncbi:MAG: ChaN family lipoprotein [Burkholderiaceae bacterium]
MAPGTRAVKRLDRWGWLLAATIVHGGAVATEPTATTAAAVQPATEAVDASGRPINVSQIVERVRSARYVLLGEIHDNPRHHRLRAALLRSLLADGVPTRVVFEQMDRQHNAAIAAAPRDTEAIVEAGRLDRKGWAWPLHRPLFDAVLEGGAAVVAGNLGRAQASQVVRSGLTQAPPDLHHLLSPAGEAAAEGRAAWTAALETELLRLVEEGHCGALPRSMLAPMALAQRSRDAALASAMSQAPAGTRVVLIAGNGHVRRDIGVPHYLAVADKLSPDDSRIVSIGFLERSSEGKTSVDGPYDEAWFTERVERPDPCASFSPPTAPK